MAGRGQRGRHRRRDRPARGQGARRRCATSTLNSRRGRRRRSPAIRSGRIASTTSRRLIPEFIAVRRRPQVQRGRGDRRRLRPLQGREHLRASATRRAPSTESRLKHNFGMARPEGYRKAVRLMEMADRFDIPVLALVDTAGAYPGIDAEERGQAEAIARSTDACLNLGVPNVAVILGEGGSGGAVAIATANRVLMLEHAIYSVISPEGAASILWRDTTKAQDAATNMKITAADLHGVRHHRRHRHRADRRRPPRSGRRHRRHRRGVAKALRRTQGARPRDRAPAAPRQVPGDRPRLSRSRPVLEKSR